MADIEDVSQESQLPCRCLSTELSKERRARILVVDDNAVNQMTTRAALERFDLQADWVGSGAEAIEALAQLPYDLVLTDLQMPRMDGLEACRRIRDGAAGERNNGIPVIGLIGQSNEGDRRMRKKAGITDCLSKPIESLALREMLKRHLPKNEALSASGSAPVAAKRDSEREAFNAEAFLANLMQDRTLAVDIAAQLRVDLRERASVARKACVAGESERLCRALHSIKGLAGNCSCMLLYERAAELEELAQTEEIDAVAVRLAELDALVERTCAALDAFLSEQA